MFCLNEGIYQILPSEKLPLTSNIFSCRKNLPRIPQNLVSTIHDGCACGSVIVSLYPPQSPFPGYMSDGWYSRLQHSPTPDPRFGFFVLGKPLSCICHGAAMFVTAIGAYRCWRCQNAITRGKAICGGFEIILLWLGIFLVSPCDRRTLLSNIHLLTGSSTGLDDDYRSRDCGRRQKGIFQLICVTLTILMIGCLSRKSPENIPYIFQMTHQRV